MTDADLSSPLIGRGRDAVDDVLRTYQAYHRRDSPAGYPEIIQDVRVLSDCLQRLEDEGTGSRIPFQSASPRVRHNIVGALDDTVRIATLLQVRIRSDLLPNDATTRREITSLTSEFEFFLRTHGSGSGIPIRWWTDEEQREIEHLRLSYDRVCEQQESGETEIGRLQDMIETLNNDRAQAQAQAQAQAAMRLHPVMEFDADSKLLHIKRLHSAISSLGLRRPRSHGLEGWEDLRDELGHMLDHIKGINEQLRDLEQLAAAGGPSMSRARPSSSSSSTRTERPAHSRTKSEPQAQYSAPAPEPPSSSTDDLSTRFASLRVPSSPTESNISMPRVSPSVSGAHSVRSSRKRRSRPGFFSDQGR